MVAGGQGGVDSGFVANGPGKADVVWHFVMNLGRTGLGSGFGIYNGRQRLVIHFDQVKRVIGNVGTFGNDNGHTVANVTHPVNCQRMVGRQLDVGRGKTTGNGVYAAVCQIFAGKNGNHTFQCLGGGGVNAVDFGVGIWATFDRSMSHPIDFQVGYIPSLPLDKAGVFDPFHAFANVVTH